MSDQPGKIKLFEAQQVRAEWDAENEKWWFSVVDIVAVLTESADAAAYWRKLKQRLKAEGNETVTSCHGLKMRATDGKLRLTDVADTAQILRLVQSIPSKRAEPFKLWLAQVGSERLDETVDPQLSTGAEHAGRIRRHRYFTGAQPAELWTRRNLSVAGGLFQAL